MQINIYYPDNNIWIIKSILLPTIFRLIDIVLSSKIGSIFVKIGQGYGKKKKKKIEQSKTLLLSLFSLELFYSFIK